MKWIIIVIVAVIIVAGGSYFIFGGSSDDSSEPAASSDSTEEVASGLEAERSSLNALLARGENVRCTYDVNGEQGRSTGVAYISGERLYGEFSATVAGDMLDSRVIKDGTTQYVWDPSTNEGYKHEQVKATEEESNQVEQAVDPDQEFEFKCESWSVDESMFDVPGNVTFSELPTLPEIPVEATPEAQRQACAALTDATARAVCEDQIQ